MLTLFLFTLILGVGILGEENLFETAISSLPFKSLTVIKLSLGQILSASRILLFNSYSSLSIFTVEVPESVSSLSGVCEA